ncbi:DegT/DnrJ/EryC1/StrS family aminotransferase [Flammeovirga yaeyamensis]|uniref:DegT/DnrJ/EryC1/StrS family aminotransferase n=1 Tax=Flammeovirga yaeyamensis TaxID=367791 RepID=A0AAX1N7U7_9BACT|nr:MULTISPECIES: DegT/DnrJ/EryC1/StrS family aminotransferase [Flammeovirga]ANQ48974.1 DegT/DnrJ/EryC1/StrS family aminotransferase [Flammeovirga sp. MY04]MBB3699058.1 8-amino-3,8-dideoxy-alpha-D-manno-octulosonate transaminase [Flammeovirga yaeyamensis]NMF36492.1 DegT/DnrJ/EryC1/StrS family aminotransferase [Flammeovirga yaeyamensis]QWG03550.1 DegT/DnrJ/EryC1/StrS family aminotransferase [Flammeovirga yaeyamensis]
MPGTEYFGDEERKEVMDVLESGMLFRYNHDDQRNGHWKAREFEELFQNYTGAKHAHAVSSGSAAVACMMAAAGIGHGDEVICTPFTFIAPIEAVLFAGGIPVFAEVDETLNLSAASIEAAITPRTKAVLLVHMCGAAADLDGIKAVCDKHNIKLLEDAGQALGAFYKGKHVGLFGEAGAVSFDFFKITTAGEGGVCFTNDTDKYEIMGQFSDHGHSHVGDNRGMEPHPIMGFNYRLGELNAAVAVAQMRKLEMIREQNRKNKAILKERLRKEVPFITFRCLPDEEGDSATFLNFFMETPELALKASKEVQGVAYWYTNMYHFINQWDHLKQLKSPYKLAIHDYEHRQDWNTIELPKSQNIIGRLLSIGIRATWTEEEINAFADQLISQLKQVVVEHA